MEWETKQARKPLSHTVLNPIETEGQELIWNFLGDSISYLLWCSSYMHLVYQRFAENMCLEDGKKTIEVLIIAADHKLVHFNSLWCHLFYALSGCKGMHSFHISPAKNLTISAFPAIKSTKSQPSPSITTKTVAYIFALIIHSVTLHQL